MDRYDINGSEPAAFVLLTQYDPEKGEMVKNKYINTCYHMAHAEQWKVFFANLDNDDGNSIPASFDEFLKSFENNKEN